MTPAQLRTQATKIARQVGVPVPIFLSLISHESGWDTHAKSPAGAGGLTQLMPTTAKGLGVTDIYDPIQNLTGGAKYLKAQLTRFGSVPLALAAYNAGPNAVAHYGGIPPYKETQRYVRNVMADANMSVTAPKTPKTTPAGGPAPGTLTGGTPLATPVGLTAPSGMGTPTSDPLTDQVFQNLGDIGKGESPTYALSKLAGLSSAPTPSPTVPSPIPAAPVAPVTRTAVAPNRTSGASGQISIAQGANRPGVKIKADILAFAKQVAAQWGHELTITTGTNHNQFVAGEGHTQSAHWTGEAVDIAVNHNSPGHVDPKLTALGQAALIAAGMPPAQARKQHGGVYNIGHFQILFNTTVGGNHYNHLHLGIRR